MFPKIIRESMSYNYLENKVIRMRLPRLIIKTFNFIIMAHAEDKGETKLSGEFEVNRLPGILKYVPVVIYLHFQSNRAS